MSLWPFKDRRNSKRFAVDWEGSLTCRIPDLDKETVFPARVINVSSGGACVAVERMHAGSTHLVIGDRELQLELAVPLDMGLFKTTLEVVHYNWFDDTRRFHLNTVFCRMSPESRALLDSAIGRLSSTG